MARPATEYQTAKRNARNLLIERLQDVDPLFNTISLSMVRRFFHQHGKDAYLDPVLKELKDEGFIQILSDGLKGTVYVNQKCRDYADGK